MMINDIFLSFHTDDPSQIQLACDFWELREDGGWLYPVKDLMATTGLRRVDLLETVQSAATAVCLGIRCERCHGPLLIRTRSERPTKPWRYENFVCSSCITEEMAEERQREADKEQLEKQRLAAILQEIKANRDPYDYSGIPLYGAIIACSIMIQSESACETGSIENISGLGLCATTQLLRNLVGSLHDRHIILFGDNTKIEALSPKSTDSLAYSYFPLQVDWQFAPPADGGTFRDVFRHLNEVIEVRRGTSEYVEAVRKIWWEVSRDEIEHHLRGQLKTYGLPEFNVGDKFREAFDYVLQRFSVPKSRYLIYRVAKNAAALSTRVDFNRGRAINTIPGTLLRDCDRAIADSWNINGYTLKWDTEEPQLFTFLFDRLLGTGIGGFRMTSGQFLEQILHQTLEDERQISKGPDIIQ